MRRGYSLIELLVALAILATISSVTLRLMFAGDRALQANAGHAASDSMALRLLGEVSDDLRAATSVSTGQQIVVQRPDGPATYTALPDVGLRRQAREVTEDYPGVKLTVRADGRLWAITITGKTLTLRSAVAGRRAGR